MSCELNIGNNTIIKEEDFQSALQEGHSFFTPTIVTALNTLDIDMEEGQVSQSGEVADKAKTKYSKSVAYKKRQIADVEAKLATVTRDIKVVTDAKAKSELVASEFYLKKLLEGDPSTKSVGLRGHLKLLEDNEALIQFTQMFEEDLKVFNELIDSGDANNLDLAKEIVTYYESLAVVSLNSPILSDAEFDKYNEEGFTLEDQKLLESRMDIQHVRNVIGDKLLTAKGRLKQAGDEYVYNLAKSQTHFSKVMGENTTVGDVLYDSGIPDIHYIDSLFFGPTEAMLRENGILPDLQRMVFNLNINSKYYNQQEFEKRLADITPRAIKRMKELGFVTSLGTPDFNVFRRKSDFGKDSMSFIRRYSATYERALNNAKLMFNQAKSDILADQAAAKATGVEIETKARMDLAYKQRNDWVNDNNVVIDLSQLPEVRALFPTLFPEALADTSYSENMKSAITPGHYSDVVKEAKIKIGEYLVREAYLLEELEAKGLTGEELATAKAQHENWVLHNSPIEVGKIASLSNIGHTRYSLEAATLVPRKEITDKSLGGVLAGYGTSSKKESGYYDTKFAKIESDDTLMDFHDTLVHFDNLMRENLSPELYKAYGEYGVGAVQKTAQEILTSGDLKGRNYFYRLFKYASINFKKFVESKRRVDIARDRASAVDPILGISRQGVNASFITAHAGNIQFLTEEKIIALTDAILKYQPDILEKTEGRLTANTFIDLSLVPAQIRNVFFDVAGINPNLTTFENTNGSTFISPIRFLREAATHTAAQEVSFDLPFIMRYMSSLSSDFAARNEALPVIDIINERYKNIKASPSKNSRDRGTKKNRSQAIAQIDFWVDSVVRGRGTRGDEYGIENVESGIPLDELNKTKMKEVSKLNSLGLIGFLRRGLRTRKKVFSPEELRVASRYAKIKETLDPLDPAQAALLDRINTQEDMMGGFSSGTNFAQMFLDYIRWRGLAYNVKSQFTNLAEGFNSNMIAAAKGDFYSLTSYKKAVKVSDGLFRLGFKNVSKLTGPPKNKSLYDAAKVKNIADKYKVIQDSTNEYQEAQYADPSVQGIGKARNIAAPYALARVVEFNNQTPILVAIMMETKIAGTNVSLWDALDYEGNLLPEYNTPENQASWGRMQTQEFSDFKSKVEEAIKVAHGNYLNSVGMRVKGFTAGKALMVFKTWTTAVVHERLGAERHNLMTGVKTRGRFKSLTPTSAIAFSTLLAATVGGGPLILAAGAVTGLVYSKFQGTHLEGGAKEYVKETTEMLKWTGLYTADLMLNLPLVRHLNLGGFIDDKNAFQNFRYTRAGVLDVYSARDMRGNAMDLALSLRWSLLMLGALQFLGLLAKAVDDGDDENDTLSESIIKGVTNFTVNFHNGLLKNSYSFANPVGLFELFTSVAPVVGAGNMLNVSKALQDTIEGKPYDSKTGESKLLKATNKAFTPSFMKGLGFSSSVAKAYSRPPWEKTYEEIVNTGGTLSNLLTGEDLVTDLEQVKARRRRELKLEGKSQIEIDRTMGREFKQQSKEAARNKKAKKLEEARNKR